MIGISASERGVKNISIAWKDFVADYGGNPDGVTNNLTAFNSWRTFALAQSGWVGLRLEPGTYSITGTFSDAGPYPMSLSPFNGIDKLVVMGYGANVNVFGSALANNNTLRADIDTVSAGSTTVVCKDSDKAALYSGGDMILVAGVDIQGFGYPPNPAIFEWARVASVDGLNVHLTTPLLYSYSDAWPRYFDGGAFEIGGFGAATICKAIPEWDVEHRYYGLTSGDYDGQIYTFLRKVRAYDVKCPVGQGWIIGACEDHAIVNQDHTTSLMEVDKLTSGALLKDYGPSSRFIQIQSSSVDRMHVRGGTRSVQGTARHMRISGGVRPFITLGPIAYGISEEIVIEDDVVTTGISGTPGLSISLSANLTYEGDGVFRYQGTSPPQWLSVPSAVGMLVFGSDMYSPFRVLDVTSETGEAGSPILIQTTLAGESLPQLNGNNPTALKRHSAPDLTVTNCSGSPSALELSQVAPNSPYGMFRQRTIGSSAGTNAFGFVMGRLQYIRVNVTQAYTGVQSSLNANLFGQFSGIQVNLKVVGNRYITAGSATGTQTGDTNLNTVGDWIGNQVDIWIGRGTTPVDLSGESPSVLPIIEFEVLTDQEIPAA